MMSPTLKSVLNLATGFVVAILVTACVGNEAADRSIDKSSVGVKVYGPLLGNCGGGETLATTHAGDGDGGPRTTRTRLLSSTSSSCSGYVVQIEGSCGSCDSLLVERNGNEVTISTDVNGYFRAEFMIDAVDGISLTPMSLGALGEPLYLALTGISVLEASSLE